MRPGDTQVITRETYQLVCRTLQLIIYSTIVSPSKLSLEDDDDDDDLDIGVLISTGGSSMHEMCAEPA